MRDVKRWTWWLGLVCALGIWSLAPLAWAAPCGTRLRPSLSKKCTCFKGSKKKPKKGKKRRKPQKKMSALRFSKKRYLRRGVKRHRFKVPIRRAYKICARAAKKLRRRVCKRNKNTRPVRFKWRKTRMRVRFFMGYKKGYCLISWKCWYRKRVRVYWCQ